jgi:hypothetical protein
MSVMRWTLGAGLGVLVILSTVFGLIPAILIGLLMIPISRRLGGTPVAGALTGFGALWLVLVLAQARSGGVLENAAFWIAVGVVPLVVGCAATAGLVVHAVGRDAARPD